MDGWHGIVHGTTGHAWRSEWELCVGALMNLISITIYADDPFLSHTGVISLSLLYSSSCTPLIHSLLLLSKVEQLSEDIDSMQLELRACLQERTDLEAKKNDLQNILTNNLLKTKTELQRELEEISLSEKKQQLGMTATELSHLEATIVQNQERYGGEMFGTNENLVLGRRMCNYIWDSCALVKTITILYGRRSPFGD